MSAAIQKNVLPEPQGPAERDENVVPFDLEEPLDLAADAIVLLSADQRIIRFNQAAVRLFSYEPHEVLGQPLDLLLPERYGETHRQQVGAFASEMGSNRHMAGRQMLVARRKGGQEFPVEISREYPIFAGWLDHRL